MTGVPPLQGGAGGGSFAWPARCVPCRLVVEQQNRSFADGPRSAALLRMTPWRGGRRWAGRDASRLRELPNGHFLTTLSAKDERSEDIRFQIDPQSGADNGISAADIEAVEGAVGVHVRGDVLKKSYLPPSAEEQGDVSPCTPSCAVVPTPVCYVV